MSGAYRAAKQIRGTTNKTKGVIMDEDVTKLTDEELDAKLEGKEPEETEQGVADEPDDTSTPADEPAEELDEPAEEQPEEEVTEEATEEEPKPPSRRETLRIQQILKKRAEEAKPSQSETRTRQGALDYENALDADPETIKQLEDDRRAEGQNQYNEGLKRAEFLDWRTSLKIDAPAIEKKFPILDKNSPEFHPAVADAVNTWYLNMSGFDADNSVVSNPNVGYADFVEGYMELVQETAQQRSAQTTKNVAKQAASTGLRPDGSSAKRLNLNKNPQDMTNEELDAVLNKSGWSSKKR